MRIIIGLGNPTEKYQATRHNVGWDAITRISDDYRIPLNQKRHKALCGSGYIEGVKVILAQPLTYMNLSGESVRELVDFYKVDSEDVIVIYDDVSLDVGQLRIRKKGSAGGHNGIKSIISHLGTDEFPRIKVGVGERPKEWDLADYVLSRFKGEEQKLIREALKDSSDACKMIINDGMDAAMNLYNKKKADNEQPKDKHQNKVKKSKKVEDKSLEFINKQQEKEESVMMDYMSDESKQSKFLGRFIRRKEANESKDNNELK